MRKTIKLLSMGTFAAALAVSPLAFAQNQGNGGNFGNQGNQGAFAAQAQFGGQQPATGPIAASRRGVVMGTVSAVDYSKGVLNITNGQNKVTLRGTPGQLQNYKQGELARIAFEQYGGIDWIALGGASSQPLNPNNFSMQSTVVGTVAGLNKSNGTVTVTDGAGTQTFRSHPNLITNLVPGQFITLTYEQVQNSPWVSSIQPVAQTGAGAGLQGGQGMQQQGAVQQQGGLQQQGAGQQGQ